MSSPVYCFLTLLSNRIDRALFIGLVPASLDSKSSLPYSYSSFSLDFFLPELGRPFLDVAVPLFWMVAPLFQVVLVAPSSTWSVPSRRWWLLPLN